MWLFQSQSALIQSATGIGMASRQPDLPIFTALNYMVSQFSNNMTHHGKIRAAGSGRQTKVNVALTEENTEMWHIPLFILMVLCDICTKHYIKKKSTLNQIFNFFFVFLQTYPFSVLKMLWSYSLAWKSLGRVTPTLTLQVLISLTILIKSLSINLILNRFYRDNSPVFVEHMQKN